LNIRAFHGFGQAKFAFGGSILGSNQFTAPAAFKTMLDINVVKIDSINNHLAS